MKIVFLSSVEVGYLILKTVYKINKSVGIIYTLPLEKAKNISGFFNYEPIATKNNTILIRSDNINKKKHIQEIKKYSPDLILVCGWQRLVCSEILDIPRLGTIGFHTSLLPKYRGCAPVNWAIIMGEKKTGITMFYLTPNADDGDIIAQKEIPILFNDDCKSIYQKAAIAGSDLMEEFLPQIQKETAPRLHNPSFSYPALPKRRPSDGLIDFRRSALDIYNFVRALTKPYPGAFYYNVKREKVIVWRIEIVFDETRLQPDDTVFDTLDFKVRVLDMEVIKERY